MCQTTVAGAPLELADDVEAFERIGGDCLLVTEHDLVNPGLRRTLFPESGGQVGAVQTGPPEPG